MLAFFFKAQSLTMTAGIIDDPTIEGRPSFSAVRK
jgi:hypothetical protein